MNILNKIKRLLFQLFLDIIASVPTEIGRRLRYFVYKPLFKSVKGKFIIDTGVTILGFNNIELGENVFFQKNSYIFANDGGNIKICDNFYLGINSQLCAVRGNITIGSNVLIAPNCVLRPDNHIIDSIDIPIIEQGYEVGSIEIKDDVWIASNCVILNDVLIEEGAVIAAGAVVSKNVKKYTVNGGVPAKFIRNRGK